MRTFLACAGILGQEQAIQRLVGLVRERQPDAVLFAGGILDPTAERGKADADLLEKFFAVLGENEAKAMVIPGPNDVPLSLFLRAGINVEAELAGVHVVHNVVTTNRDVAISGVGGELTQDEDRGAPTIRCSRTTAEYYLRELEAADQPQKVLLLAVPPNGQLGGKEGNTLAGELIDSYHPKLCVVAGPTDSRGIDRVAHTTIVNPGRLADNSAAWIDWNREFEKQVEFIDL